MATGAKKTVGAAGLTSGDKKIGGKISTFYKEQAAQNALTVIV